jgi:uracil-DNA glycosylase
MDELLQKISSCDVCLGLLPNKPKPILQVSTEAKILIIGQAPGQKVQTSGIPWDDQSGNELRRWLGVSKAQFYSKNIFALMPMGFCYPGSSPTGDFPPRPECAPLWHPLLLASMPNIKLILLIGQYAQKRYLNLTAKSSLTETVKNYHTFLPRYLPLVHPSPRNKIWQKKNPWFETDVVPVLQGIVKELL